MPLKPREQTCINARKWKREVLILLGFSDSDLRS